jgi:hypothetical protein
VTRIQRETIANLLIVGFCLVMFIWAIPTYTPKYPGYGASPRLVPNVAVGIMMAMAGLSLVRLLLARFAGKTLPPAEHHYPDEAQSTGFTQIGRINLRNLALFMIPSILLVVGIEDLGYVPVAFLFLMVLQYVIGNRKWLQMTVLAIAAVAVMYIIMRYGFGVPVPGPQLFE